MSALLFVLLVFHSSKSEHNRPDREDGKNYRNRFERCTALSEANVGSMIGECPVAL